RFLRVEQPEGGIDDRGAALYQRQRMHHRKGHALARYAEKLPAALGLRAPQPVGRHLDRSEGVLLGARAAHGRSNSSTSAPSPFSSTISATPAALSASPAPNGVPFA